MIGAGKSAELYKLGRGMGSKLMLALAVAAFFLHAVRGPVAAALSLDPKVVLNAAHYLTFACCAAPLKTYSMIVAGIFAGAGATSLSCKVNCAMTWAIQIPLAFALRGKFGETGIYLALLVSQAVACLWFYFLFTGKKWIEYGMRTCQNVQKNHTN